MRATKQPGLAGLASKRLGFFCIAALAAALALGILLTWISTGFTSLTGWATFSGVVLLGGAILGGGWWLARKSENQPLPARLALLLVGAAILRLGMGVVWFVALPQLGHRTPSEQSGYVMSDALNRDQTAWKLAISGKPLSKAFGGYPKADQYGGLLGLSAAVYRYLGGPIHQPLRVVVLTAAFSALAVLFTWLFIRRVAPGRDQGAAGEKTAWIAAWGLALYPEAVLLGSSQMREAFMMTLAATAFYGLVLLHQERVAHGGPWKGSWKGAWKGLVWSLASLGLFLLFSPPFAVLLVILLAFSALVMERKLVASQLAHSHRLRLAAILILAAMVIAVLFGSWLALRKFAPPSLQSPLAQLQYWMRKSAEQQAYLSERASGKLQALFDRMPAWLDMPLLVIYGILQPFLPAALVVTSEAPIWQWIAIWRSAGWMVLLGFMLYAFLRSLRKTDTWTRVLTIASWLTIVVASYRGGGDQWDNPRYRVTFAGVQIGLAALVWAEQRRTADAWFRRALVTLLWVLAWFIPYYLQRQYHIGWPVTDLFKTFGLGLICSILYCLWDWARRPVERAKQVDGV